jgi:ribosomal protein L7/L12
MTNKRKEKLIDRILFCDHKYSLVIALTFFGLSLPVKDISTIGSMVLFVVGFTILAGIWFQSFTAQASSKVSDPERPQDSVLLKLHSQSIVENTFIRDCFRQMKEDGKVETIKHIRSKVDVSLKATMVFLDAIDGWMDVDELRMSVIDMAKSNNLCLDTLVKESGKVRDQSGKVETVKFIREQLPMLGLKETLLFVDVLPQTAWE